MASTGRPQPTRAMLEAMVKLKNFPEFQPFTEYLKLEKDFDMSVLAGANDDAVMHRAQGAYRRTGMILDAIEHSPALLDQLVNRKAGA